MPAYVLAEIEITHPDGYKEYTRQVVATIEKYGGRFLVRGNPTHALEGDWPQLRRVLLEFPSTDAARKWWDSPEYATPKEMRRASSKGRLLLLEGAS